MEDIVVALPSLDQEDYSANRKVDLIMDPSGIDGRLSTPQHGDVDDRVSRALPQRGQRRSQL